MQQPEFGHIRSLLWLIHRHELKKLIPMLIIFFLIVFNYSILRTVKDTVVVTAKGSGASVIPFIEVWMMLPMTIGMTWLFSRLSNRYSQELVFYILTLLFLGFFATFTFVLYPYHESLHSQDFADWLQDHLPTWMSGFVTMLHNWIFAFFYVMCELWANIILLLLFWGFANEVTKIEEAKRFYALFGAAANISPVLSGQFSIFLSGGSWEESLHLLTLTILISGVVIIGLYRWLHVSIIKKEAVTANTAIKSKEKLSLKESFQTLLRSPYLTSIAVMVLSYFIVINIVEILWKDQLRELYPLPNDYNIYLNKVSTATGIVATCLSLFVSGNAIRKFGWTFTALIPPIILLCTSGGFFFFFLSKGWGIELVLVYLGMTPLMMTVFFGSLQNCLSRASKFTLFDITKELALVPLDSVTKLKGKSCIDGVCARMGKSGGSIVHQVLIMSFGTMVAGAHFAAMILFMIVGVWILSICRVGKEFRTLTHETTTQPAVATA